MDTKYLGVTYDRTKAMDIPEEQFKLCKEANGQFCPLMTPLQPLTNPPSCVAALYTKNSQEINRLCELTTKTQPELYLPIPLASNMWVIISSPFKQQPPVTVICPTKPAMSIHISPPIHILRLEPACSATSQHFHLPPKYEDTHVTMNLSIYNANLDIINIVLPICLCWLLGRKEKKFLSAVTVCLYSVSHVVHVPSEYAQC